MRTFAALLFLFTLPLHAHFVTRIHYAPNVVRHGQTSPVKVIVGTDGTAAKLSIKCTSGVTVAMVPIGKGVFTANVAAKDVLFGYTPAGVNKTMFGHVHALTAAGQPTGEIPLNLTINVLDANVPIVPIADLAGRQRVTRRVVNIAIGLLPNCRRPTTSPTASTTTSAATFTTSSTSSTARPSIPSTACTSPSVPTSTGSASRSRTPPPPSAAPASSSA